MRLLLDMPERAAYTARTRIAPTPSGYLHVGNGVAFLITAELARQRSAVLRLRIDDIDAERTRPEYLEDIFSTLAWLGIKWTEGPTDPADHAFGWSQSARLERYLDRVDVLKEQGDLYACTCTRREMRAPTATGRKPCGCRTREIAFDEPAAAWRLRIPSDAVVRMETLFGGPQLLKPADLIADPVIRQRSVDDRPGRPSYQIASLMDDVDHDVTFIVRGDDLLPSTACQLYMADRLGLEAFGAVAFLHHPLLADEHGDKLSKSDGAAALRSMRDQNKALDGLKRTAERTIADLMRAPAT